MAYEEKVIKLKNVRLSYPTLFVPKYPRGKNGEIDKSGTPKYSCSFIFDPTTEDGKRNQKTMLAEIKRAVETGFKEKVRVKGTCLKAQDDELIDSHRLITATEGKQHDEYQGMLIVSCSNKNRPVVVDRAKNPVTAEDDLIYAGCYVNASLTLWVQDNDYGKRINANLRGVQFLRDGEAFGGTRVDIDEEFDDIDDDDDYEDYDDEDFDLD